MNIKLITITSSNTISILFKTISKQSKNMPFCKFCKDSGKSQREFTSHYPKDKPGKSGKVVCPTILSNDCRYCHKKGHAKSHCPLLKEKNNRKRLSGPNRFNRRPQKSPNHLKGWAMTAGKQQKPRPMATVKRSSSSNPFAALSEQDDTPRKVVALPKVVKSKAAAGSWAKKPDLNKEAIQQRLANIKQELAVEEQLKEDEVQMTPLLSVKEAYAHIQKTPTYIGAWADAVDNESDDEEEIVLDGYGRPATDNSAW